MPGVANDPRAGPLTRIQKEARMTDVSKIKEHMDVIDSTGKNIGQVDHMDGSDKIKLTSFRWRGSITSIPMST